MKNVSRNKTLETKQVETDRRNKIVIGCCVY